MIFLTLKIPKLALLITPPHSALGAGWASGASLMSIFKDPNSYICLDVTDWALGCRSLNPRYSLHAWWFDDISKSKRKDLVFSTCLESGRCSALIIIYWTDFMVELQLSSEPTIPFMHPSLNSQLQGQPSQANIRQHTHTSNARDEPSFPCII